MSDLYLHRMAQTIAGYCTPIRPGDLVAIQSTPLAEPVLRPLLQEIVTRGGIPTLLLQPPWWEEMFLKQAPDEVLERTPPLAQYVIDNAQVRIVLLAEDNTRRLSGVDPARQGKYIRATIPITRRFMERQASGELRWCAALFPTQAYAQDAGMSLADFEEFVFEACFLKEEDPAERWRELGTKQQQRIDQLKGKETIRILARDTDLTLSIRGRTFVNAEGHCNLPDGEFYTSPVEDSVNGHIRYSFPAVFWGREVDDVRLWFEEGRVVKATAGRNQDFLQEMLDLDAGARRLGEFAFGNNYGIRRFTRNILFDEKIGGTVHLALGASYPETGGRNKSALHWDMICDLRDSEAGGTGEGGEIWVDGVLFSKDGRFVL